MQGKKKFEPKILYQTHLEDLVAQDSFYRQLEKSLDLRFLYKATLKYYGKEGQESIDPVVFYKMLLVGYLNNIHSDRKLVAFCSDSLSIRWYLGYDIDEKLPWHSTISRTRQLYGEEVFLDLFKKVLGLCVQKGMVSGKRQAVDSAFIKANASMDSLVEKEVLEDASAFVDELEENSEYKVTSNRKKLVERHHAWKKKAYKGMPAGRRNEDKRTDDMGSEIRPKYLSNHTHYSPTDPDARVSVKPGKARQLNYFGQLAVDTEHHVITGACSDFADKRDSQCLEQIVRQTKENLEVNHLSLEEVLADTGYSSGEALHYLEQQKIEGWIPNFGQYKPEREGFVYNEEKDQYECIKAGGNGAVLPFRKIQTDAKGYSKHVYRSTNEKCKTCPLRSTCIGKSDFKKLDDSIHKEYYDRMHQKLSENPLKAKRMSRIRSKTVEPVLGTLLNFLNMKRVNTRGIKMANKHVLMAALSYNLKKYLKFQRKSIMCLHGELCFLFLNLKNVFSELKFLFLRQLIFSKQFFFPKQSLLKSL